MSASKKQFGFDVGILINYNQGILINYNQREVEAEKSGILS